LGSVLFGSFLIALIWTLITAIVIYKEFLKAAMSHEKLVPIRDKLIACAIWCLMKLKDCVDFGNKLAFINISIHNTCCFCKAMCAGFLDILMNFGKAMIIMMVSKFFVFLG